MKQKQTILVIGATGAQGGSVAKALLKNNKFAVRIFTRNSSSKKAIALQQAGAEIAVGDLDNIESLRQAMNGVYGVFGVTNYWEHFEKEYQQGKNIINAVKASGIKHFVFSALPDYNKLSNGSLVVPHYDLKAALQEYAKSLRLPASFVHLSFYYENFLSFFPLQKHADGSFFFALPQGDTAIAGVSVEDLGGVVATIFNHPTQYIGRTVRVVGEDAPFTDYAHALSYVLQYPVNYRYLPRAEYAALDFQGAEDVANMFEVQRLYIPNRQIDLIESYGLNPAMQPFKEWVVKNRQRFIQQYKIKQEEVVM